MKLCISTANEPHNSIQSTLIHSTLFLSHSFYSQICRDHDKQITMNKRERESENALYTFFFWNCAFFYRFFAFCTSSHPRAISIKSIKKYCEGIASVTE
jgi:hypothetical protein